jgi:hypothetical protein
MSDSRKISDIRSLTRDVAWEVSYLVMPIGERLNIRSYTWSRCEGVVWLPTEGSISDSIDRTLRNVK